MRKEIISILFLLGAVTLQAQEIVDKVMYRIVYKTDCVKDTTERDSAGNYNYDHDEMALDIGTRVSKFYSLLNVKFRNWLSRTIKHGGEPALNDPQPPRASILWFSFHNYPEGKETTLWSEDNTTFKTEEPITPIAWKIIGDTCTLLGYRCTNAEADYKGRHWTVWYAEDIPIYQGPWQLGGLPGLILKAGDSRSQWMFTATALQQMKGKEAIDRGKRWEKYDLVTKKKYYHWKRTVTKDDLVKQISAMSGVKVTLVNKDGEEYNSEEYRKNFMRPDPFNPLDLSE